MTTTLRGRAEPGARVLASDPHALSDAMAFWLLVLATAAVIGLVTLAVLALPHLLVRMGA